MNLESWTARLAHCLHLELLTWRVRMSADALRAFALDCQPWHSNALVLSFLTERESYNEAKYGKWCLAEWRLYDFTSGPTTSWPAASELMAEAHGIYTRALSAGTQAATHGQQLRACVEAMHASVVTEALQGYQRAPDF
jgi:hypothetical protein